MPRRTSRGLSVVELAATLSISGSLLAIMVPVVSREVRTSKFIEPMDGISHLGTHAMLFALGRPPSNAFPDTAPLTPKEVPQGTREVDPPGTWDHPTWQALRFRPSPEGVPHAFSFSFQSESAPGESSFMARAHGDLDGDGIRSTFEVGGHARSTEPGPVLDPMITIVREVE